MASFFDNLGQRIDQGIAGLYNRDQVVDLENQYGNEYGLQQTGTGIGSDARHMAAMNNLSNTLSNSGLGLAMGLPSELAGDVGAFGAGLINELPALSRGFNKENFGEIGEDISANFRGTFETPNSTTAEDIYSQVFTGAVPQRVASGNPMGYGAAQASELTDLERDFPGMSTGDIIDSMNNRGPVATNIETAPQPKEAIYQDRIMNRNLSNSNYEPKQGILQGLQSKIGAGFNNVKDFAMDKGRMGRNLLGSAGAMALGLPGIVGSGAMALMGGMGNQFADKTLYGDTIDENGNVYSADQLNKMNAAGGGYTDPARSARRRTSRISKMRARDFNNKKISQTNLNRLVRQEKAQQAARESATAARAMARNPQVYANAGITSGGFASQNTGSNSNFSNKSGRGRTGYQEGGLASMFTRRR
jgi:hypothetical protein